MREVLPWLPLAIALTWSLTHSSRAQPQPSAWTHGLTRGLMDSLIASSTPALSVASLRVAHVCRNRTPNPKLKPQRNHLGQCRPSSWPQVALFTTLNPALVVTFSGTPRAEACARACRTLSLYYPLNPIPTIPRCGMEPVAHTPCKCTPMA